MRRRQPAGNRGFALIGGYLLLSALLIYSNVLTMNTVNQQAVADRLREELQARDLSQAALDQLQEDLNWFLTVKLFSLTAAEALDWLDHVGTGDENPKFDVPTTDTNGDTKVTSADSPDGVRDGATANPTCVTNLPVISYSKSLASPDKSTSTSSKNTAPACHPLDQPAEAPRAWIVRVESANPGDPVAPRRVVMNAEARVGAVTKRLEATYQIELGMSNIFQYAYFINNYGWFDTGDSYFRIQGDVRANGDIAFTRWGGPDPMTEGENAIHGDLYAAANPELINPKTAQPSVGDISGDVGQYSSETPYWEVKGGRSRPLKDLTFPGQPAPGGTTKTLPEGWGWDPYRDPVTGAIDQRKFEAQSTKPMPYLGDLNYYKSLAKQKGSELAYWYWQNGVGFVRKTVTVDGVYAGPDGVLGNADDKNPLVLDGLYADYPIEITGPIVVPGDVIIKGMVKGRGTIYAGRNVHVVGSIHYVDEPYWASLQRHAQSGDVREVGCCPWRGSVIGKVCTDGTFYANSASPPADCMPASSGSSGGGGGKKK